MVTSTKFWVTQIGGDSYKVAEESLMIFVIVGVAFLALLGRKVLGYIHIRRGPDKKKEDQQDGTITCLLLTSVSTCFGHHCGALSCRMRALLASCKTAPHNRYQPHPAEPEQHTKCSNRAFVLLKMDIMMPETC